jgi:ATP phosphoribosyltransferase regulatory subunit
MVVKDRWLLPDGIDELLPGQAARLERVRRGAIDLLTSWGYELIEPPLIEYLDSLLSGMGEDLDLQTFKLIDQETGRMMGLRADITLQAARIDVHRLRREAPTRLCYCGPVLHALTEKFAGSRNPIQLGAELYGCSDLSADAEVIRAMLEILRGAGVPEVWLALGHVGIFRALLDEAGFDPALEAELFEALQRKDAAAITSDARLPAALVDALLELMHMNGDPKVLDTARRTLLSKARRCEMPIEELARLVETVEENGAKCHIHVDLAEMRGYRYHTGVIFAAYTPRQGDAVAKGGRYDNVGAVFGRARPATGFDTDLKRLALLAGAPRERSGILAPCDRHPALAGLVESLRAAGERVVNALNDQPVDPIALGCDRRIVRAGDEWLVVNVEG